MFLPSIALSGGLSVLVVLAGPAALAAADPPAAEKKAETSENAQASPSRLVEKLGRGLVARPTAGSRMYLSWRLLDDDPGDVAFNVYRLEGRGAEGGKRSRLNREPILATTDFVDEDASPGPKEYREYVVRSVAGGREGPDSEIARAAASDDPAPAISIRLDGDHTFQKLAIADLDGDGRPDYVIKQPDANVDPYEQYWKKSPGTYKIEAYDAGGKFLWRHDMGWSIEQGIWYSPWVAHDLDGDGKAEVALKAGEGDPRDADGRVQTGPEYVLILDGLTGKERARADWPDREGLESYNLYCRNQMAVAYLDGRTPSLLVQRGTYRTIKLRALRFEGGQLRELWRWTDRDETGGGYAGQGAHCLRAADIDGDGKDEIVLGSAVIDDQGRGLWTTRLGHPDHVYIGDLDPSRPGLEIYYGIEARRPSNGMCMVDAATGKILWGIDRPTRHVHGQGLVADLDPRHPGCETYSADTDAEKRFAWALLHDCKGNVIGEEDLGGFAPRAAYWDADHQREIIGKGGLRKLDGTRLPARIEGTVVGVADILGDWREEIVTTVPGEMRIHVTTMPASDRRVSLLRDPFYRADISTASQGYYQIPTPKVLPGTEQGK